MSLRVQDLDSTAPFGLEAWCGWGLAVPTWYFLRPLPAKFLFCPVVSGFVSLALAANSFDAVLPFLLRGLNRAFNPSGGKQVKSSLLTALGRLFFQSQEEDVLFETDDGASALINTDRL